MCDHFAKYPISETLIIVRSFPEIEEKNNTFIAIPLSSIASVYGSLNPLFYKKHRNTMIEINFLKYCAESSVL